jgi:hypothetical protein
MMNDNFDDEDFEWDEDDEREFNKRQEAEDEKLRTHPLYIQANEILNIVDTLIDTAGEEDVDRYTVGMQESAMIILTKLSAALLCDSYVICMQYAAIIRDHGHYLRLINHSLKMTDAFDKKYVEMFRAEMEKFRELFNIWAAEIKQMDRTDEIDEWGLFMDLG